jgi:hypothetical protein
MPYSNGNSFGNSAAGIGREPRSPVPWWKFGTHPSADRGCI